MKRIICITICFLLMASSLAHGTIVKGVLAARKAVVASGSWYVSGTGSETRFTNNNAYLQAGRVTCSSGGSLTKVAVWFDTIELTVTSYKIALYKPDGTLHESKTISAAPTYSAYNEITLATPLTVTTGQNVVVAVETDNTVGFASFADGLVYWYSVVYASFPPANTTGWDSSTGAIKVRVYVQ